MSFEKLLQQSIVWRGFYFITILLVNVVLSRFLQADGTGWIYYLTNFFSFILLIATLSMESGFTFFASNQTISYNKLAWFSIFWTALIAIVISIIIGLYFSKIKTLPLIDTKQYLFYTLTYVCGIVLINFFTVLFYAQQNFWLPNLIMGICNVFLCLAIVWLSNDVENYHAIINLFFVSMIVQGVFIAIAFFITNSILLKLVLPTFSEFKVLLKYSLVALAGNLVFFFVYRIDYWFVRYNTLSCSPEDLGNYIQASKLGQLLLVIPQILASVIFPQTARGFVEKSVNKSIFILFRIFLLLFSVAMLGILLIGDWVFPAIFGQTFNNITIPLLLLLPGIFGVAVLVLLSAYFSGKGKVNMNVKGASLALLVVIVGDVIFIPKYGIYAAAIVSAVAYLINLFYALWYFYKDVHFTFKDLLMFSKADLIWIRNIFFKKQAI